MLQKRRDILKVNEIRKNRNTRKAENIEKNI